MSCEETQLYTFILYKPFNGNLFSTIYNIEIAHGNFLHNSVWFFIFPHVCLYKFEIFVRPEFWIIIRDLGCNDPLEMPIYCSEQRISTTRKFL